MLKAHNLSCSRGDRRLFSKLEFILEPGELLYLEGPNGSGKTTLLRTLSSLFTADSGEITWDGKPTRKLGEVFKEKLLYLGHHNAIKPDLTALENLSIASWLGGQMPNGQDCLNALSKIGLDGYDDLPSRVLSQGQKRRVALARLLISRQPLWILDEPFTALDVAAVTDLQNIIKNHIADNGMVILTTHQEVDLTSSQVKHLHLDQFCHA